MPDARTFWDNIAESYAAQPIRKMEAYRLTMERTRAHLSIDDRVLEVGCGTGSTALLLAPDVAHITASDISSEMIAIGSKKAAEQKVGNVGFVRATPHEDAFSGAPFDAVMAFNFLHLVEDLPATLRRLRGLLRPRGLLISKTPCLGGKRLLFGPLIFAMRAVGKAPPTVGFFTARQFEMMVVEAGFEIVESGFHGDSRPFIVARRA